MAIVVPKAAQNGYVPDCWFSPNSVENFGRPYPYMIFKNMEALKVSSVKNVVKVGDTVSDIKEGIAAGVTTVGVIEGSSIMGLSQEAYEVLTPEEQEKECQRVAQVYKETGADHIIRNIRELESITI